MFLVPLKRKLEKRLQRRRRGKNKIKKHCHWNEVVINLQCVGKQTKANQTHKRFSSLRMNDRNKVFETVTVPYLFLAVESRVIYAICSLKKGSSIYFFCPYLKVSNHKSSDKGNLLSADLSMVFFFYYTIKNGASHERCLMANVRFRFQIPTIKKKSYMILMDLLNRDKIYYFVIICCR